MEPCPSGRGLSSFPQSSRCRRPVSRKLEYKFVGSWGGHFASLWSLNPPQADTPAHACDLCWRYVTHF